MSIMEDEGYGLDRVFEASVVLHSCEDTRFYGRVGHAVDPGKLSTEAAKWALRAARLIAKGLGHGPGSAVLVIQRLKSWNVDGKVPIEVISELLDLLELAEDMGPGAEATAAELIPVVKQHANKAALDSALEDFAKGRDFTKPRALFDKASRLGEVDTSIGVLIGEGSWSEIEKLRHLDKLATSMDELDLVLGGGLPRGAEGVLVGISGAGKSVGLNQIYCAGLSAGLHCGYATLELPPSMIAARITACLTGLPINDVLSGDFEEGKRRLGILQPMLGPGVVKEFAPGMTQVEDVTDWIKLCEDVAGRQMDLLVVDYADKMTAKGKATKYEAMEVVYEGLRHYAQETKTWCWTASQSTGRGKVKQLDLEHIADSMNKVRVADLVVTINTVETPMGDMETKLFVAKNRTGRARMSVGPMPCEFHIGRLAPSQTFGSWEALFNTEDDGEGSDDWW